MTKKKRPTDIIERAILIAKIATGELTEPNPNEGKNASAISLGKLGGNARKNKLTAKERSDIAKRAAKIRWGE